MVAIARARRSGSGSRVVSFVGVRSDDLDGWPIGSLVELLVLLSVFPYPLDSDIAREAHGFVTRLARSARESLEAELERR